MKYLLAIILTLCICIPDAAGGMSYCTQADEVAKSTDRRMIYPTEDGKDFQKLLDNKECDESTNTCVLRESYGACGSITQFMDGKGNGMCDYVIEWKSIVDPQYGVFFHMYKVGKCPLSI